MESAAEAKPYHCRPASEGEIIKLAQLTLLRADSVGVLPTPLDELYKQARIKTIDLPPVDEIPALSLSEAGKHFLRTALQKVRGIADLRRRAVYLPTGHSQVRRQFAKAHELGHQLIPWQKVCTDCVDTDRTLSPRVREVFETEANLFASEVIFQGKTFSKQGTRVQTDFGCGIRAGRPARRFPPIDVVEVY